MTPGEFPREWRGSYDDPSYSRDYPRAFRLRIETLESDGTFRGVFHDEDFHADVAIVGSIKAGVLRFAHPYRPVRPAEALQPLAVFTGALSPADLHLSGTWEVTTRRVLGVAVSGWRGLWEAEPVTAEVPAVWPPPPATVPQTRPSVPTLYTVFGPDGTWLQITAQAPSPWRSVSFLLFGLVTLSQVGSLAYRSGLFQWLSAAFLVSLFCCGIATVVRGRQARPGGPGFHFDRRRDSFGPGDQARGRLTGIVAVTVAQGDTDDAPAQLGLTLQDGTAFPIVLGRRDNLDQVAAAVRDFLHIP